MQEENQKAVYAQKGLKLGVYYVVGAKASLWSYSSVGRAFVLWNCSMHTDDMTANSQEFDSPQDHSFYRLLKILYKGINTYMDSLFKPKIHLRLQQFSAKRSITTIEGLDKDLNLEKICAAMRKAFSCNGTVQENTVIQLQGDHRVAIRAWFIKEKLFTEKELQDRMVIHG